MTTEYQAARMSCWVTVGICFANLFGIGGIIGLAFALYDFIQLEEVSKKILKDSPSGTRTSNDPPNKSGSSSKRSSPTSGSRSSRNGNSPHAKAPKTSYASNALEEEDEEASTAPPPVPPTATPPSTSSNSVVTSSTAGADGSSSSSSLAESSSSSSTPTPTSLASSPSSQFSSASPSSSLSSSSSASNADKRAVYSTITETVRLPSFTPTIVARQHELVEVVPVFSSGAAGNTCSIPSIIGILAHILFLFDPWAIGISTPTSSILPATYSQNVPTEIARLDGRFKPLDAVNSLKNDAQSVANDLPKNAPSRLEPIQNQAESKVAEAPKQLTSAVKDVADEMMSMFPTITVRWPDLDHKVKLSRMPFANSAGRSHGSPSLRHLLGLPFIIYQCFLGFVSAFTFGILLHFFIKFYPMVKKAEKLWNQMQNVTNFVLDEVKKQVDQVEKLLEDALKNIFKEKIKFIHKRDSIAGSTVSSQTQNSSCLTQVQQAGPSIEAPVAACTTALTSVPLQSPDAQAATTIIITTTTTTTKYVQYAHGSYTPQIVDGTALISATSPNASSIPVVYTSPALLDTINALPTTSPSVVNDLPSDALLTVSDADVVSAVGDAPSTVTEADTEAMALFPTLQPTNDTLFNTSYPTDISNISDGSAIASISATSGTSRLYMFPLFAWLVMGSSYPRRPPLVIQRPRPETVVARTFAPHKLGFGVSTLTTTSPRTYTPSATSSQSVASTGGVNRLHALPFFAWFARSQKVYTRNSSPPQKRYSQNYWQAYTMLRLTALQLCNVVGHDDDALATLTTSTFSCDKFDQMYPADQSADPCNAKQGYDAFVNMGNGYCGDSSYESASTDNASPYGGSKIQFCQLLKLYVSGDQGWDVGGCAGTGIGSTSQYPSLTASNERSEVSNPSSPPIPTGPVISTMTSLPSVSYIAPSGNPRPQSTCSVEVDGITYTKPVPSYQKQFTTALTDHNTKYLGLPSHGESIAFGLPCGYTSGTVVPTDPITGELTNYVATNGIPPACGAGPGDLIIAREAVVAIGWELFDSGRPNGQSSGQSSLCNRKIHATCLTSDNVTREGNFTVRDRCTGCRPQDIDVPDDVYHWCTPSAVGRAPVTWAWLPDEMAQSTGAR